MAPAWRRPRQLRTHALPHACWSACRRWLVGRTYLEWGWAVPPRRRRLGGDNVFAGRRDGRDYLRRWRIPEERWCGRGKRAPVERKHMDTTGRSRLVTRDVHGLGA